MACIRAFCLGMKLFTVSEQFRTAAKQEGEDGQKLLTK